VKNLHPTLGCFDDKYGRSCFIKDAVSWSSKEPWNLSFKKLSLPKNCYGSRSDVQDQHNRLLQARLADAPSQQISTKHIWLILYYSSGQRYVFSVNNTFYTPFVPTKLYLHFSVYKAHYRICAAYLDQYWLWSSGTCNRQPCHQAIWTLRI
jgi:hypothetical protein